jgi:phospholipid/cholesterol/gamma-HCH transport system substrate-binding protein
MPSVISRSFRRIRHSDRMIGVISVVVVAVIVIVVTAFYIAKPGQQTVSFSTRDAVAVDKGTEVRVAGVNVGEVSDLELKSDHVRVNLKMDPSIAVGDRSRVEVRLLTAVGGYFVTVIPEGQVAPGSTDIPQERVLVPYTIADTLQELPRITDNVEGQQIDETLAQIGSGMTASPQAVRSIVGGLQSLSTVIAEQRKQIRSIGNTVSEYTKTFNESRDFIFELIRKLNVVILEFNTHVAGYSFALNKLGQIILKMRPFAVFYLNHRDEVYGGIVEFQNAAQMMRDSMNQILDDLVPARERLSSLVRTVADNQDEGMTIDGSKLCFPMRGRTC